MANKLSSDPWIQLLDLETKKRPVSDPHKKMGRPASPIITTDVHARVSVDIKEMLYGIKTKLTFVKNITQVLSYAIYLLHYEVSQLSEDELSRLKSFLDLTSLIEDNRKKRR